jgi:hypothetical protein
MFHTQANTTSTTTGSVTHLSGTNANVVVALTLAFVLLAGVVIAWSRKALVARRRDQTTGDAGETTADQTIIRSWIAIVLVGALAFFCAVSFEIDDTTLRSLLLGGLVASTGTAVAFYFASKAADQARQDVLNAALGKVNVPQLKSRSKAEASGTIAALPLTLTPIPATAQDEWIVVSQEPTANQLVLSGSGVKITLAGLVPNIAGLTLPDAKRRLQTLNLMLGPSPADAPAGAVAQSDQEPLADSAPPDDRTVRASFGLPAPTPVAEGGGEPR